MIERIRLGNATVNRFLFMMGEKSHPFCDRCPGIQDSVEHYILECPAQTEWRRPLLDFAHTHGQTLSLELLVNLPGLELTDQITLVSLLATFLERTGLRDLFLWNLRRTRALANTD